MLPFHAYIFVLVLFDERLKCRARLRPSNLAICTLVCSLPSLPSLLLPSTLLCDCGGNASSKTPLDRHERVRVAPTNPKRVSFVPRKVKFLRRGPNLLARFWFFFLHRCRRETRADTAAGCGATVICFHLLLFRRIFFFLFSSTSRR